jgi:hypothetical protein
MSHQGHKVKNENGLTVTQQKFVDILPDVDFNASKAYKLSRHKKVKDITARVNGHQLLTKTNIQAYLIQQASINHVTPSRVFHKIDQLIDHKKAIISPLGPVLDADKKQVYEDDTDTQLKALTLAVKVLPQFSASHQGGGAGDKHLHLHGVQAADLAQMAGSGMLPGDEPEDA